MISSSIFAAFSPDSSVLPPRRWPCCVSKSGPGHNARQLRNLIDRIGVLAEASLIDVTLLEPFFAKEQPV